MASGWGSRRHGYVLLETVNEFRIGILVSSAELKKGPPGKPKAYR